MVYILDVFFSIFLIVFAILYMILFLISLLLEDKKMKDRALSIALSIDQAGNNILGGSEDHTISGRMGWRIKNNKAGKFEIWLCKVLSKIDHTTNKHCIDSIEYDEVDSSKS